MKGFIDYLNEMETETDLVEAGNVSAALATKIQNDVIKFGRNALRARRVEDKIDLLAKQNGALSGLIAMSIAVSGDKSLVGTLLKGLSMRKV